MAAGFQPRQHFVIIVLQIIMGGGTVHDTKAALAPLAFIQGGNHRGGSGGGGVQSAIRYQAAWRSSVPEELGGDVGPKEYDARQRGRKPGGGTGARGAAAPDSVRSWQRSWPGDSGGQGAAGLRGEAQRAAADDADYYRRHSTYTDTLGKVHGMPGIQGLGDGGGQRA